MSWPLPAGSFADANGDGLSYTALVLRPEYTTMDYSNPAEPREVYHKAAWVALSEAGLSINASTGELYGNVRPILAGEYVYGYTVKIVATDPSGASAEGGFWKSGVRVDFLLHQ